MKTLISALLILATLSLIYQVNGERVLGLIRQYHECKYLKMYFNGEYYKRNESIANNTLPDSFYMRLGLASMTLDQSMNLIRKIYTDTPTTCTSSICNCTRLRYLDNDDDDYDYGVFFRNASNFVHVKSIIRAYNTKRKSSLKSLQQAQELYAYDGGKKYPTIVRFLMNAEYTSMKSDLYKTYAYCRSKENNDMDLWVFKILLYLFCNLIKVD